MRVFYYGGESIGAIGGIVHSISTYSVLVRRSSTVLGFTLNAAFVKTEPRRGHQTSHDVATWVVSSTLTGGHPTTVSYDAAVGAGRSAGLNRRGAWPA